jgi:hypothetical protein
MLLWFSSAFSFYHVVQSVILSGLRSGKEQVTEVKRKDHQPPLHKQDFNFLQLSSTCSTALPRTSNLRDTTCALNRTHGTLQMSILRVLFRPPNGT